MQAFTALIITEHLYQLRLEAAQRHAQADKPGIRARIASTAAGVRAALSSPTSAGSPILPKLDDYPYRS
ncbi:MAG TPA: hypothetical protein VD763_09175 [Candidatus Saccharimonadales bacterium]|nr:hypothetical protein [Candidatus Saccharimonadales bacterium]